LHFIPAAMVTSHDSEATFLYVTAATLSSIPFCANRLHTKLFNIHSLSSSWCSWVQVWPMLESRSCNCEISKSAGGKVIFDSPCHQTLRWQIMSFFFTTLHDAILWYDDHKLIIVTKMCL
jgi:hypothetical protein